MTHPRRALGSGTAANATSRSTGTGSGPAGAHPGRVARIEIGEDAQADTADAPVTVLA